VRIELGPPGTKSSWGSATQAVFYQIAARISAVGGYGVSRWRSLTGLGKTREVLLSAYVEQITR